MVQFELHLARNLSLHFTTKTRGNSKPKWSWQKLTVTIQVYQVYCDVVYRLAPQNLILSCSEIYLVLKVSQKFIQIFCIMQSCCETNQPTEATQQSPLCPHCGGDDETAQHLLLCCPTHMQARTSTNYTDSTDPRRMMSFLEMIGAVTRPPDRE